MRRLATWALFGAVVLTAPGCAKQLTRIETRTDEIATTQAQMAARQRDLAAAVERLDQRDAERENQLVERRAELETQLAALDRVVRQLDARGQEQEELLRRISAALDLLTRQRSVPASSEPVATDDETAPIPVAGLQSPGQDVFDAAFDDYTGGRYALARDGFTEVLTRFGSSELADEAQYWLAETWYAEGDYERARQGFEEVVDRYPDSDLQASSLLKLAFSMVELGQSEAARNVLERLQREHPDSDEALIAEHRLSTLSGEDD